MAGLTRGPPVPMETDPMLQPWEDAPDDEDEEKSPSAQATEHRAQEPEVEFVDNTYNG